MDIRDLRMRDQRRSVPWPVLEMKLRFVEIGGESMFMLEINKVCLKLFQLLCSVHLNHLKSGSPFEEPHFDTVCTKSLDNVCTSCL